LHNHCIVLFGAELQQQRGQPDRPAHEGQAAEHDGKQTTLQETCSR
jgi:hypothetical protein